MAPKKTKGGKAKGRKVKATKTGTSKSERSTVKVNMKEVKEWWASLSMEGKRKLLEVDVATLRAAAQGSNASLSIASGDGLHGLQMTEVLEEGLSRLRETWGTWSTWSWPTVPHQFKSPQSFLEHLHKNELDGVMLDLLQPAKNSMEAEEEEEEEFQCQMISAIETSWESFFQLDSEADARLMTGRDVEDMRQPFAHLNAGIMKEVYNYHDRLYLMLVLALREVPVLRDAIPPEGMSCLHLVLHLYLELLEVEELRAVACWWFDRILVLVKELPRNKEGRHRNVWDEEPFMLTEDGQRLVIHPGWLQELENLDGSDGEEGKEACGNDKISDLETKVQKPQHSTYLVDWLSGMPIWDAQQRCTSKFGPNGAPVEVEGSLELFKVALRDLGALRERWSAGKHLMKEIIQNKKELSEVQAEGEEVLLTAEADSTSAASLPSNSTAYLLLRREMLLASAKLHCLTNTKDREEKLLSGLKAVVHKAAADATFYKEECGAEILLWDRVRQASNEQENQAKFSSRQAYQYLSVALELQGWSATRDQIQAKHDCLVEEITKLQQWLSDIESLLTQFDKARLKQQPGSRATTAGMNRAVKKSSKRPSNGKDMSRVVLNDVPSNDMVDLHLAFGRLKDQLFTEAAARTIFSELSQEVKDMDFKINRGRVALRHMEANLVGMARQDWGDPLRQTLIFPLLLEKLTNLAGECASQKALKASVEVLPEEEKIEGSRQWSSKMMTSMITQAIRRRARLVESIKGRGRGGTVVDGGSSSTSPAGGSLPTEAQGGSLTEQSSEEAEEISDEALMERWQEAVIGQPATFTESKIVEDPKLAAERSVARALHSLKLPPTEPQGLHSGGHSCIAPARPDRDLQACHGSNPFLSSELSSRCASVCSDDVSAEGSSTGSMWLRAVKVGMKEPRGGAPPPSFFSIHDVQWPSLTSAPEALIHGAHEEERLSTPPLPRPPRSSRTRNGAPALTIPNKAYRSNTVTSSTSTPQGSTKEGPPWSQAATTPTGSTGLENDTPGGSLSGSVGCLSPGSSIQAVQQLSQGQIPVGLCSSESPQSSPAWAQEESLQSAPGPSNKTMCHQSTLGASTEAIPEGLLQPPHGLPTFPSPLPDIKVEQKSTTASAMATGERLLHAARRPRSAPSTAPWRSDRTGSWQQELPRGLDRKAINASVPMDNILSGGEISDAGSRGGVIGPAPHIDVQIPMNPVHLPWETTPQGSELLSHCRHEAMVGGGEHPACPHFHVSSRDHHYHHHHHRINRANNLIPDPQHGGGLSPGAGFHPMTIPLELDLKLKIDVQVVHVSNPCLGPDSSALLPLRVDAFLSTPPAPGSSYEQGPAVAHLPPHMTPDTHLQGAFIDPRSFQGPFVYPGDVTTVHGGPFLAPGDHISHMGAEGASDLECMGEPSEEVSRWAVELMQQLDAWEKE